MYYIEFTTKYQNGPAIIHTEEKEGAVLVYTMDEVNETMGYAVETLESYDVFATQASEIIKKLTYIAAGSLIANCLAAAYILFF